VVPRRGEDSDSGVRLVGDSAEPGVERFPKEAVMHEEHKAEEPEVEAHTKGGVNLEPAAEEDDDNDVVAHVRKANVRMDLPRKA
jgi:hypothetical protein